MKNYECPECGYQTQADDWRYCSRGHKEAAMYEVLHWDHKTRKDLLATITPKKFDPSKSDESNLIKNITMQSSD
jgi:hypothetical protein